MICQLNENNYCARHRKIHAGRELHWAISDTPKGEEYRLYWDKLLIDDLEKGQEPTLLRKIVNFSKAVISDVISGRQRLKDCAYQERINICKNCPKRTPKDSETVEDWKCTICGCWLNIKARWASQDCPEGLWPKLKEEEIIIEQPQQEQKSSGCGCKG